MLGWISSLMAVKYVTAPDSHHCKAAKALSDPRWIVPPFEMADFLIQTPA